MLFTFALKGQTYSISPAKTVSFTAVYNTITTNYIYLVNTGSSKIALTWETALINMPANWNYSICDPSQCFPGIPAGPTPLDSIDVGAQSFLGLNVDCGVFPGSGVVKVFAYQNGFRSNGDTLTWYVTSSAVNVEEIFSNDEIKIFPNPVANTLNINISNYQVKIACVNDIFGRTMLDLSLSLGLNKIDLSNLPKGFYVLNLELEDTHLFKRIIVE